MSNYTQVTFFAPKDALLSGNPAKIIKGADVDPELSAISVAIATKYDSSNIASGPIAFASGAANAPSITFSSATGTGLYLAAANSLGFAANGVAAGSIASTGAWSLPAASAAVTLSLAGAANQYVEVITANSTSGQSLGLKVLGGTNSSDTALLVQNQAGSATYAQIFGDGHGTLGPSASLGLQWATTGAITIPTPSTATALTINDGGGNGPIQLNLDHANGRGIRFNDTNGSPLSFDIGIGVGTAAASLVIFDRTNAQPRLTFSGTTTGTFAIKGFGPIANASVDMTPDTGSFTGTLTGVGSGSGTCVWARNGNHVTLFFPAMTGTSSAATLTMTGLPSAIQTTRTQTVQMPDGCMTDAATVQTSGCSATFTASSGTVTFNKGGGAGNWTNTATNKGISTACSVSYLLN